MDASVWHEFLDENKVTLGGFDIPDFTAKVSEVSTFGEVGAGLTVGTDGGRASSAAISGFQNNTNSPVSALVQGVDGTIGATVSDLTEGAVLTVAGNAVGTSATGNHQQQH